MITRHECQFELWEECNSFCKFCYLGNHKNNTPKQKKIENLLETLSKISDDELYNSINCLAYIGGEFFQGQINDTEVHQLFMNLMKKTNKLLNEKKINEVWLSASLMLGDQKDLYEALSFYQQIDKVWILTSYDTIGRFNSINAEKKWIYNLEKLRNTYPNININITSILTGDFIKKYLSDRLEIEMIAKKFNCSMFWKPPAGISTAKARSEQVDFFIPDFYPTRKSFLEFLLKFKKYETEFRYNNLFNISLRAEYLYAFGGRQHSSHRVKNEYVESFDESFPISKCGHSTQYSFYSDSDKCAVCDKKMIQNIN